VPAAPQWPTPSQVAVLVAVLPVHDPAVQVVPATWRRQAPAPLQKPSRPQLAGALAVHSLPGSAPAAMGRQSPDWPVRLQAEQRPGQAFSQQTPSTQAPDRQVAPDEQTLPFIANGEVSGRFGVSGAVSGGGPTGTSGVGALSGGVESSGGVMSEGAATSIGGAGGSVSTVARSVAPSGIGTLPSGIPGWTPSRDGRVKSTHPSASSANSAGQIAGIAVVILGVVGARGRMSAVSLSPDNGGAAGNKLSP
jgi:hypothetical protein